MRSDFINKRDIQRRRRPNQPQFTDGEVIVIPEFDTFYYHNPPSAFTDDRWTEVFPIPLGNLEQAQEVPIGLLNPWNDGEDQPAEGGLLNPTIPARTPTRAAMTFDLSLLPANAQIIDAKLNLTVASKRDWD